MRLSKNNLDRFRKIFDIPAFIVPWLDRFFEDSELGLILLLAEKPLQPHEISAKWTGGPGCRRPEEISALPDRSYRRGIIEMIRLPDVQSAWEDKL